MKRGARLAVLFVALLVLVGAWYLAATFSRRQQQAEADAHTETIDISPGAAEDITTIAWDYFGDAVSLSKSGGSWKNANDDACPIDDEAVAALAETLGSLTASAKVEDVEDFAQYGLENCAFTVVAGVGEDAVSYEIGSAASTGGQYVRLNGEDTVYVETGLLAPAFTIALEDVLQLETMPQDIDMVTGLAVQSDAGVYELRYLADATDVWYTDADPWFLMDGESQPLYPLDTDGVEALYKHASELMLQDCQEWDLTEPEKYGLDEPQSTVLLGYMSDDGVEKTVVLQFGDYADGDVYVRLEGSKMVYRVNGAALDALMYPDFDAMATMDPCALNWDKLQSVLVETDGDSYEMVRAVSTPMSEDEQPEDIYTCGERSLDTDKVDRWLRELTELPAEGRTDADSPREVQFSLTFRQDVEAFPEVTAVFRDYDSAHWLCAVNGEQFYLVSRTAAADVLNDALDFLIELPEKDQTEN